MDKKTKRQKPFSFTDTDKNVLQSEEMLIELATTEEEKKEIIKKSPFEFIDYFSASQVHSKKLNKTKSNIIEPFPEIKNYKIEKEEILQCAEHIRAGFNIAIYGIGSKAKLLNELIENHLTYFGQVIFVNGSSSAISIQDLMHQLINLIKTKSEAFSQTVPTRLKDKISLIENEFNNETLKEPIILVIHCLDEFLGADLESRNAFCRLAKLEKVLICCSINNVLYFSTWSSRALSDLSFVYIHYKDITPCDEEECSLQKKYLNKDKQLEKKFFFIIQTLTQNAKKILKIIASDKTRHSKSKGITIDELYEKCREEMLVSSKKGLKDSLLSVKDHNMLFEETGSDNKRRISLNLPKSIIPNLHKILSEF